MINLIKMDVYRLLKTKSYYVMIVIMALLSAFSIVMLKIDIEWQRKENKNVIQIEEEDTRDTSQSTVIVTDIEIEEELLEYSDANDNEIVIGLQSDLNKEWVYSNIDFKDYINNSIQGVVLLLFCVIFVPIYVNAEQKNGYIKNIAGQLKNKGMLVLSKLIVVALQVLTIFGVFVIVSAIAGKIEFGDSFTFCNLRTTFKILGIQYVLHVAMSIIIMAITLISRSVAAGITYGILSSMGLIGSIINGGIAIISKYLKLREFNIIEYTVGTCITQMCNTEITNILANEVAIKSITVSVIFIVIPTVISMLCIQRRDVK